MMFFGADYHFMHEKIITFTDKSGNRIRPFASIDEHDNTIITNHNKLVTNNDTILMLGDISWKWNNAGKERIAALNGKKEVVVGNHDDIEWLISTKLFTKVYSWKYLPEHSILCSHFPIHTFDFKRAKINVHGHIHSDVMPDPRYFNVSMEATNFNPIDLEDVLNDDDCKRLLAR